MIVKQTRKPRWAIVGGGMLGLTLAYRMSREGHDVTLIEAAPELGGLTSVWQLGNITWDKHYHVTLLSDSRLRNLLSEIDLSDQLRWVETKTGFYTNGQMHSMSNSKEFLTFPPLNLIEKLRLGATIFYASKIRNSRRLEQIPVTDWLKRWSGKGTFQKIWQPLLRAKLGDTYRDTAANFIWASINRMYKARRTGLKKEMFGYVQGGYRTIIHRLVEKLQGNRAEILTRHPITSVTKTEQGRFSLEFIDQPAREFDRVIMTVPSPVVRSSCHQLTESEKDKLNQAKYLGIVNASMLVNKKISPYYVTNITEDWVPMTAVIEMSNIVSADETDNKSLVYLPKYVPAGHEFFQKSDDEVRELFVTALEKMHPEFSRDDIEAFRIARVQNVMAIPTLGYSETLPDQKTTVPGLYVVNSAFITRGVLAVDETIRIAEEAMETTLREELDTVAYPIEFSEPSSPVPVVCEPSS